MSESGQGFRLFSRTPLYVQILIALVLAVTTGVLLGGYASTHEELINHLAIPCELVLKPCGHWQHR